jgi:hypothetical protein
MQAEAILVSGLDCRLPRQAADLRRSSMIDLEDSGVEAANAAEPGGESDLAHGQSGLVDQLLGEV